MWILTVYVLVVVVMELVVVAIGLALDFNQFNDIAVSFFRPLVWMGYLSTSDQ